MTVSWAKGKTFAVGCYSCPWVLGDSTVHKGKKVILGDKSNPQCQNDAQLVLTFCYYHLKKGGLLVYKSDIAQRFLRKVSYLLLHMPPLRFCWVFLFIPEKAQ